MKRRHSCTLFAVISVVSLLGDQLCAAPPVHLWLTDPSGSARFQYQPEWQAAVEDSDVPIVIELDPTKRFQTIDGFGYTLTGGSAQHLMRMSSEARGKLLHELFSVGVNDTEKDGGIGVSYLRISIGASDLDPQPFSYDDMPSGATDPTIARFSLQPNRADVIPVLKQILAIAPELKIMASPWSPPTWMKTNESFKGGSLKKEYFAAYATYFVKYIKAMRAEGIPIDAITPQNEPLHPGNNPSMLMTAEEQADFIGSHLGPAFKEAKLKTKIICYDHNADRPDYPLTVLNNEKANPFVDGSAFHLYGGEISALAEVHQAYPDKHLYFTEQWIGAPSDFGGDLAWHVNELIVGAMRNWCRTVLEWNLANGPDHQPHTEGGCDRCLGALTIDGDNVTRNAGFYIIAHASKFVRPGSQRIASTASELLPNVAFHTPQGRLVVIVLNRGNSSQDFLLRKDKDDVPCRLPGGAVGTYLW